MCIKVKDASMYVDISHVVFLLNWFGLIQSRILLIFNDAKRKHNRCKNAIHLFFPSLLEFAVLGWELHAGTEFAKNLWEGQTFIACVSMTSARSLNRSANFL